MGNNKNYKNLNFNSKEDYLYAANILIVRTYRNLKRYEYYRDQLKEFLDAIIKTNTQYVDMRVYEEWEDKQRNVSHNLLTCFVDDTKTGFSYVMFRRYVSRSQYASTLKPLDEEINKELNELRDVRNWTFHFAQSDFVAIKEVTYAGLPDYLKQFVTFRPNPIVIGCPKLVNAAYIESLYLHMNHRITVFNMLFDHLIEDYETLLGEKVTIVQAIESPMEYHDKSFAATQLSMAMQKNKYDGSPESFDKATQIRYPEK